MKKNGKRHVPLAKERVKLKEIPMTKSEARMLIKASDWPARPLLKQWGNWHLCDDTPELELRVGFRYAIPLETCTSTAQILDWIFQIHEKNPDYAKEYDLAGLIAALNDIFQPQANCCSWGEEKEFSPEKLLADYRRKLARAKAKAKA